VTLSGEVDWNFEKSAAYKAASRISGVKSVANMIHVRSKASPVDLRERIQAAFKRSSELDANGIDIRVDGSKVRLSGRVHGWNERRIAENAAWSAPGVTEVEDEIVLA
jgi:osmotically-inducible protein OsmY